MIYIPKISPIRIYQVTNKAFPAQDLGLQFKGIDYINFCNEIPINEVFRFQFMSDTATPAIHASGNAVSLTDITPVGWSGLGTFVYEAEYTPTTEDHFKFYINEDVFFFESTEIIPITDTSQLLEFAYMNSENDFLYVDGGNVLKAYFKAEYRSVMPTNEMDVYHNDRGEMTKLRATPLEAYELHFYSVPYYVVNMLNLIFSCDMIWINNESFQTEETISAEPIEMSNIFNASIIITRTNEDYENFTILDDGIELIIDYHFEMISDDLTEILY